MAFEGFTQAKDRLFLVPYISYGWNNAPMGSGYNTKDKIQKQYIGLMEEYGLTERFTIGSDIMFATQWSTRNGKIGGRIQDKSFALQNVNVFGRWNFYRSDDEKVRLNLYMSVNTPSFGKGTGRFDTFGHYSQWGNMLRLEFGYLFSKDTYMSLNYGYKANYNMPYDMLEGKITFFQRLPKNFMFYAIFKKQNFIPKGKQNTYSFYQNRNFQWKTFDIFTQKGVVALDLFLGYKFDKNKTIVLQYTRSLHSVIFGNKGVKFGQNTIWLELWWTIDDFIASLK